jgi:Guanine nucleotide exchange factor synembryn
VSLHFLRAVTAGPLLRASDSESCFFLQLGRCLSPGPYENLVLELDKRKLNTDQIVTSLGHENTPDVSSDVQLSDTGECAVENVASLSDVRIDQIDLTFDPIPSVTVSTADTRGFVRGGWGPLFIETCKLLYAIYGEECYIGEDNATAAPDLALLSDVLTDVILVPVFADSTVTPPGFADISTQRSCRRYALQLAMLSLDQEHTTHENRIIENIITRSGIQILCTLLNECFSELEKAAENDETNIMQGTACISNSSSAVLLYPILSLLLKVATFSEAATADLKLLIFPNPWKNNTRGNENDQEEEEGDEMGYDYLQRKMDPTDIPKGTLRARLVGSMISLDSLLKRYCAELLYALCDKNTGEFVSRTGFGNAIALMQIKGLI